MFFVWEMRNGWVCVEYSRGNVTKKTPDATTILSDITIRSSPNHEHIGNERVRMELEATFPSFIGSHSLRLLVGFIECELRMPKKPNR